MTTVNKIILSTNGLKDCIKKAAVASGWQERNTEVFKSFPEMLSAHRDLALPRMSWVLKCISPHESAGAIIKVEEDGSVYLFTGAADTGQGSTPPWRR